jgi:hypothetical protein
MQKNYAYKYFDKTSCIGLRGWKDEECWRKQDVFFRSAEAVVSALTFLHPSADLPAFLIAKVYFSTNVKRLSWMQNIYITFSLVLSNWKEHSKLFTPSIVLGLWFAMFDGHRLSPTSMAGLMSSDAIIFFKIFNTNREHIVRLYSESPCNCKNNFFHFWCLFSYDDIDTKLLIQGLIKFTLSWYLLSCWRLESSSADDNIDRRLWERFWL